jgi:bla regulator protein blaR1
LNGKLKRVTLLLVMTLPVASAIAQQVSSTSFEAASIRRNISEETRVRFETPPRRLNVVNAPLRFVIRQAYRVPETRIIGGPEWLDKDRFDIQATAPGVRAGDTIREMLRTLLRDRFGLVMHSETREMPVYVLRTERSDGRLGRAMRPSTTDCTGKTSSMVAGRVECGILVSEGPGSANLRGGAATIANFLRLLGDFLDRPVNDQSGLTGTFDFELLFTTQRSSTPGDPVPGGLPAVAASGDIPDIFTALREQLGLKLEAQRGLAEVWIVDAAAAPPVAKRQDENGLVRVTVPIVFFRRAKASSTGPIASGS